MAPRKPSAPPSEEDLPTVDCFGITKVGRGWVLVRVTLRGDKVLDREAISRDPEPRDITARRAMNEVQRNWLNPLKDVSA